MIDCMHIHPGLLDSAFQLIIHFLKQNMGNNPNIVFVPIKIGRIVFGTKGASPHLVRATLLKETSHSLNVAFTILDNEENTIAVVKEARFRAIPLNKTRQENLELLDYHASQNRTPGH